MKPAANALPKLTEAAFMRQVVQYAKLNRWLVYHTHDSRRSEPGFPDLFFLRERVVYAELKAEGGRIRPEQAAWIAALEAAGEEVYLWRPSHWPTIARVLG